MDADSLTRSARAADGDGRQIADVLVADTVSGPAPHLLWSRKPERTLCGLTPARPSRIWFAMVGCAKCRRAARTKGIATITDVDGATVRLYALSGRAERWGSRRLRRRTGPRLACRLETEQIDGSLSFDTDDYSSEAKWIAEPVSRDTVDAFAAKVRRKGRTPSVSSWRSTACSRPR